jgi:DNA-binding transcriptional regulator YhcF (GntR family)
MFAIDSDSPIAPFEQLKQQIFDAVRSGRLPSGAKLPTVRGLADELGLAPNTVARAYRELEHQEVLETRGRLGSFVAPSGDPTHRLAQSAATAFADRIADLGITTDDAIAIVTDALRAPR